MNGMQQYVSLAGLLLIGVPLLAGVLAGTGCQTSEPEYSRPLPEGHFGLRRIVDPTRMPDLTPAAEQLRHDDFVTALERSLSYYNAPSSRAHFPLGPISHTHAHTSAWALKQIAEDADADPYTALRDEFDVWESVGWDGSGEVLFTGYYSPIFHASRERGGEYQYPLYARPDDLVSDPITGEVEGRERSDGGVEPYPTRAEIEQSGMLEGYELVYLPSRLDAYLIEVNGSAELRMAEGDTMHIGYAGNNGHDYTSIGRLLVEEGHYAEHEMSVGTLRRHFERYPDRLDDYIQQNDRFIFFRAYDGDSWPAGSLGVKVTPHRTLATDNDIFPRGAVVLVDTTLPTAHAGIRPYQRLMVDQDTGGAIRAAGRGDIYIGIGERAGLIAGRQAAEGRMYYLLLKPDRVRHWYDRMREATAE